MSSPSLRAPPILHSPRDLPTAQHDDPPPPDTFLAPSQLSQLERRAVSLAECSPCRLATSMADRRQLHRREDDDEAEYASWVEVLHANPSQSACTLPFSARGSKRRIAWNVAYGPTRTADLRELTVPARPPSVQTTCATIGPEREPVLVVTSAGGSMPEVSRKRGDSLRLTTQGAVRPRAQADRTVRPVPSPHHPQLDRPRRRLAS